jgi:Cyclin, N-terminal domain
MDKSMLSQCRDMEATLATIEAMIRQETHHYNRGDYFAKHRSSIPYDVDTDCRRKMGSWQMQVVDFCKFNRESVEVASSYLDRYLFSAQGAGALKDRSLFQLAAMTCLYSAVKIHEPEAMDPKLVSSLSRGAYSPKDIENMELTLVRALEWRMNPPTALAFVRQFMSLIPDDALDTETRTIAYDIAKFQTELAVLEYNFVGVSASSTAYCCLLNALDSAAVEPHIVECVATLLQNAIGLPVNAVQQLVTVQDFLFHALLQNPQVSTFKLASGQAFYHPQNVKTRNTSFTSVISQSMAQGS